MRDPFHSAQRRKEGMSNPEENQISRNMERACDPEGTFEIQEAYLLSPWQISHKLPSLHLVRNNSNYHLGQ